MSAAIAERERAEGHKPAGAVDAPPTVEPTLYDTDFFQWCFTEADKMRLRRWAEIDWPNVIEELESLGKSFRLKQKSSYRLVISHLLKWQFQPQKRTSSWQITIVRERSRVLDVEEGNKTLQGQAQGLVDDVYRSARRQAQLETGLPLAAFPPACPYTLEQLRDEEWMPE